MHWKLPRRRAVGALVLAAACLPLWAQEWKPTRPITLMLGVAPGSSVDMVARLLAEKLPAALGQPVIVVNRPGASGLIAAAAVAHADADGHTLLLAANTMFGAPHTLPKAAMNNVDVMRDLVPIVIPATSPMVVMAHPSLGVKTPRELVAYVKNRPGLGYATSGAGSPFHFAGEMFKAATGTEMIHVPYKGVMPAIADTVAGQVQITFGALGGATQFIDSGRLVPVAVGNRQRSRLLPHVATLRESGIPIDFELFFPLMAPARTPAAAIARLHREVNAVMQAPEIRGRLQVNGVEANTGTPEQARTTIGEQYRLFGKLAAEFNIKAD